MAIQWIIKSRACARALFTGLLRYARNDKGEVRALFTGLLRYARNDKGWGACIIYWIAESEYVKTSVSAV